VSDPNAITAAVLTVRKAVRNLPVADQREVLMQEVCETFLGEAEDRELQYFVERIEQALEASLSVQAVFADGSTSSL